MDWIPWFDYLEECYGYAVFLCLGCYFDDSKASNGLYMKKYVKPSNESKVRSIGIKSGTLAPRKAHLGHCPVWIRGVWIS